MKPWKMSCAHTALAMLCLSWVGCGGGDAADTTLASKDESAPAAPQAAPDTPAPKIEESAPTEPAPSPAATTKGDSSATSELLALSSSGPAAADAAPSAAGGTPAVETVAATGSGPPGYGGAPGVPGAASGYPMPGGASGTNQAYGGGKGMTTPSGYPGGQGGSSMPAGGMPASPGMPGMAGADGMPGGRGAAMPGMDGGGMTPASGQMNGLFALQYKAVTDFLNAAKSKDKDKLAEVVALRSPQEAATDKNKKLFAAILDQSISDAEVAEISKAFEGFTIMGHNEARSTGKLGIILSKSEQDGGQYRRTIYVRKEAKGWKVVDVSGLGHIEQPVGGIRRPTTARKR